MFRFSVPLSMPVAYPISILMLMIHVLWHGGIHFYLILALYKKEPFYSEPSKKGIARIYMHISYIMTLFISCLFEVAQRFDELYIKNVSHAIKSATTVGKREKYKLMLGWCAFEVVTASAKQWTDNLHELLYFHFIYLQISQICCIHLNEKNYLDLSIARCSLLPHNRCNVTLPHPSALRASGRCFITFHLLRGNKEHHNCTFRSCNVTTATAMRSPEKKINNISSS